VCILLILFILFHLATKLNSTWSTTRSTLLKVDRVALAPNTLATKTTVSASKLNYAATVDFVAVLLPVSATVDFQQSRPCWINFVASVYRALDEQLSSVHLRDNCSSSRSRTQSIRTKYRWHDGRFDTGNMACFCRCECRPQISSIAADWCSSKSRTAV